MARLKISVLASQGVAARSHVRELHALNTLGRHPENSIQILDRIISKEHCRIELRGTAYVLHDLGSMNGTYVNGRRVQGETRLYDGDEIALGQTKCRFEDPGGEPRPEAPPPPSAPAARRGATPAGREGVRVVVLPRPPPREGARTVVQSDPAAADYERLRRYFEASQAVTAARDPAALVARVATYAGGAGALVRHAMLFVRDADDAPVLQSVWRRGGASPAPDVSHELLCHALTQRAAAVVYNGGAAQGARAAEGRTAVALPLVVGDEALGLVWLEADGFWDLSPRDLELLTAIARQAALVVEVLQLAHVLPGPTQLH